MKKLSILALAAMTSCASVPVMAQTEVLCMDYQSMTEVLQENFGESLVVGGLTDDGKYAVETFVNEGTRTWTTIMIDEDNIACRVAHGYNMILWESEPLGEDA